MNLADGTAAAMGETPVNGLVAAAPAACDTKSQAQDSPRKDGLGLSTGPRGEDRLDEILWNIVGWGGIHVFECPPAQRTGLPILLEIPSAIATDGQVMLERRLNIGNQFPGDVVAEKIGDLTTCHRATTSA